jgi:hypothetical protein
MEPFRAFVADLLPEEQRTRGFAMQSLFIGLGAVVASALPWMMTNLLHVQNSPATGHAIPLTVRFSFYVGAVAFLGGVIWTIVSTKEYPPDDLEAFAKMKQQKSGLFDNARDIFRSIGNMPPTMKRLAWVQLFTWLGLFCMWLYFPVAVAHNVFGAVDGTSPVYTRGVERAGHTINPVRLLIRGRYLSQARVELQGSGLSVSNVHSNATGSYLFIDLTIDPHSKPGRRALEFINAAGSVSFPFDVLAPLPRQNRFQGFSRDDFIYEIMPDRFSDGDPAMTSFFQGGKPRFDGVDSGVDSVFDFPLLYPLRRAFAEGKPLRETAAMLSHDYLYQDPSLLVTFVGNHDMPRFMNEPGAGLEGLKLALTFIMTTRGVPMIYSGDELAMPGGADPDNRRDFPGGWPGDPHNAFEASGRSPDQEAVFARVVKLAHLRHELEPLRRGKLVDLFVSDQVYAYARLTDLQSVVVIINNAVDRATVEFDAVPARLLNGTTLTDRLGGGPPLQVYNGRLSATLPGRTASIYVQFGK